MAKISLVSAKYVIHATINIDGIVEKPDVIGAIFGQTEGLLGSELELRELQRSGKIGRIEVDLTSKQGKTNGGITIPSSLDMAEVSIVGAALEIIQRIGPCNAKIEVKDIEDVRVSKRQFVVDRAKELLRNMVDKVMPDSQEIAEEVAHSVRMFEIKEYGKDKLPAGPAIEDSDEILVVEGRADVLNLLKYGIKNAIAINGSSVPKTIVELSKQKILTVFVDGDRGGDLNIKELMSVAEIDFVTKAPDGKEVEELTKKEIHKALRGKISVEQAKLDFEKKSSHDDHKHSYDRKPRYESRQRNDNNTNRRYNNNRPQSNRPQSSTSRETLTPDMKKMFGKLLDDIIGSRGAYLLNKDFKLLGKVPLSELAITVENTDDVDTVIIDGVLDDNLVKRLEASKVSKVITMSAKANSRKIRIFTSKDLK